MESYIPGEALKPFVKTYLFIESGDDRANRIVPATSFAMAFRIRGQISYVNGHVHTFLPSAVISGLRKSVRVIHYTKNSAALIVQFKEQGISAFFKQPLHHLFEQSVSLDNCFPSSEIALLEERLAETEGNTSRIALVEQFLLSKIHHHTDKLVAAAIEKIRSVNGNMRIRDLAKELFISQDAFEKRFRKITGATPKQFSYIVKMNAIIRQNSPSPSLVDMVYDNGHYDQSHFNKDFKTFTGQTPTEFFKSPSWW